MKRALFWLAIAAVLVVGDSGKSYGQTPPFGGQYPIEPKGVLVINDHSERTTFPSLGIQNRDLPAELRFRTAANRPSGDWYIEIQTDAGTLRIDPSNVDALESADAGLDILIAHADELKIRFSQRAPNLIYRGIVHLTGNLRPEFLISDSPVLLYVQRDLTSDRQRQIARAIVRLDFTANVDGIAKASQCTGFQIRPGVFLTAMHCADPAYRPAQGADPTSKLDNRRFTTVRMAIDESHPDGRLPPVIATVSGLGSYREGKTEGGLDYAVLIATSAVPQDLGTALIDLSKGISLSTGTGADFVGKDLEIYQIWSGQDGAAAGNVVAMNSACKIGSLQSNGHPPSLNLPLCPTPDFMNGCDSEGGGSGAPLFLRGTDNIVGLLWGGISIPYGNCGVSIDAIKSHGGL